MIRITDTETGKQYEYHGYKLDLVPGDWVLTDHHVITQITSPCRGFHHVVCLLPIESDDRPEVETKADIEAMREAIARPATYRDHTVTRGEMLERNPWLGRR